VTQSYTANLLSTKRRERDCSRASPKYPNLLLSHSAIHTAATKVLRTSKNIRTTQEFMGHSKITTTEIYTHVIDGEVDKAVKEAFD